LLLNILTSDSLAGKRHQNAFLSTPSGLALSLESFATKSARTDSCAGSKETTLFDHLVCMSNAHPSILVDRRLSFACIADRSAGFGFVSVSDCRRRELGPRLSPRKRELTGCAQLE
jgi:hypothetical protein